MQRRGSEHRPDVFGLGLLLLGALLAFSELRISANGFVWVERDADTGGWTLRLVEITALLLLLFGSPRLLKIRGWRGLDLLAFLLIVAAGVLGSPLLRGQAGGMDVFRVGFAVPLLVFLVCRARQRRSDFTMATAGLILGATLASLTNLGQALGIIEGGGRLVYPNGLDRFYGFGQDASYQSFLIAIGFCLVLARLTQRQWTPRSWGLVLLLPVLLAGLVLTFGVTGLLAAGIGSLIVLRRASFGTQALAAGTVGLILVVALLTPGSIVAGAAERVFSKFAGGDRFRDWGVALEVFFHYPLLGVGFENYQPSAQAVGIETYAHTQNAFLAGFVYMGIAGGLLTMGLLVGLFLELWRRESASMRWADSSWRAETVGALSVLFVFFVFAGTEEIFFSAQASFAIWPYLGVATAPRRATVPAPRPAPPPVPAASPTPSPPPGPRRPV